MGLRERYLEVLWPSNVPPGPMGAILPPQVAWQGPNGRIDQIAEIIDMLQEATAAGGRFYENTYEIALFDPGRDLKKRLNRQCLSFIELKPDRNGRVHMMAAYRNHFYVQRALGNLIGLGRPGVHCCGSRPRVSSHDPVTNAELDTRPWSKTAAHALIDRCAGLLQATAA